MLLALHFSSAAAFSSPWPPATCASRFSVVYFLFYPRQSTGKDFNGQRKVSTKVVGAGTWITSPSKSSTVRERAELIECAAGIEKVCGKPLPIFLHRGAMAMVSSLLVSSLSRGPKPQVPFLLWLLPASAFTVVVRPLFLLPRPPPLSLLHFTSQHPNYFHSTIDSPFLRQFPLALLLLWKGWRRGLSIPNTILSLLLAIHSFFHRCSTSCHYICTLSLSEELL
jgi:hypothetical protein